MFRIIREIHPAWVVGENVANLTNFMEFEDALLDLESEGYEVQAFIIPASAVGAWHQRKRVWIVAKNTNSVRCNSKLRKEKTGNGRFREFGSGNLQWVYRTKDVCNTNNPGRKEQWQQKPDGKKQQAFECGNWWKTEPTMGRVANGIPGRVDRLKALGNAIVPQVAYEIFKAIDRHD